MYTTINGWTKARMIEQIRSKNNGTRSVVADGNSTLCAYRGDNGNACAAGCFIPDSLYLSSFENKEIRYVLLEMEPRLTAGMPLFAGDMRTMQNVHDSCGSGEDVRDVLTDWIEKNVVDAPAVVA